MATVTNVSSRVVGNKRVTVSTVAMDSVYPTGGEAITANQLGLANVETTQTAIKSAATTTVNAANAYYDASTNKVLVYDETPAQIANSADIAGLVLEITATGT
jgi:hypothetical protein